MTTSSLWVFTLSATAGAGCTFPEGETHALLAAAIGIDDAEAGNRVEAALAQHGWTAPVWSRSGRIDHPESAPEGTLRAASDRVSLTRCVHAATIGQGTSLATVEATNC